MKLKKTSIQNSQYSMLPFQCESKEDRNLYLYFLLLLFKSSHPLPTPPPHPTTPPHYKTIKMVTYLGYGGTMGDGGWVKFVEQCPTLCNPLACSPPGFSVHGISEARILEWVAISFSRSSQPRDQNCISYVSCIAGRFFTCWAIRKAPWLDAMK